MTTRPIRNRLTLALFLCVVLARGAEGARVAHEGFMYPSTVNSVLSGAGHVPAALTPAQVENGALLSGNYDVFAIGRYSTMAGVSARYVAEVGRFVASGGNVVTELHGAGMFFSAYASDVSPRTVANTPQLQVFSAILHAGNFLAMQTPVNIEVPAHPVAAGLPNPLREYYGEDTFHWVETADPDLQMLAEIVGNGNTGFPRNQKLPCLLVGCYGHASLVFPTWDWEDTLGMNLGNRRLFLNAIAFAAQGCNQPPVAEIAGQYRTGCQGSASSVVLDGTRSSDPEGDILSYLWTSDCAGSSFDDPSSPTPRFTADTSTGCGLSCIVTLTVSDGQASSSASAEVVFEDVTPPAIALNGPGYLVLQRRHETYTELGATATDACDPSVSVIVGGNRVDPNVLGIYAVTYDSIDRCGNAGTQVVRTVEVKDTIPPAFTRLPNDLVVECEGPQGVPGDQAAVAAFLQAPEVSEGCDPGAGIANNAPSSFPLGSTLVTWTARDWDGNPVTASRTVQVVDTTPPVMVSPADAILECPADTSVEANGVAAASDRCGEATVAYSDAWEAACGSTGTLVRTWIATDGFGNSSAAVQTLRLVDTTPPAIALHGAGEIVLEAKVDQYVELGAAASDRCDGEVEVTIGGDRVNASVRGTYVVTYDAQDRCGNRALRAIRTVSVRDTVPPAFTSLPNDLTVECQGPEGVPASDPAIAVFLAAAQASDSCDGSVGVFCDAPPAFPIGDTLVTWTAQDLSGNPVSASRTVHVVDTTPPVLVCPADVLAEYPHDTSIEANGIATASDLCGEVEVVYSEARLPDCGAAETVTRSWKAVDGAGNTSACTQTIRVVDTTPPQVLASAQPLNQGTQFLIRFSASDPSGVPVLSAAIETGCRAIPVQDGQTVTLTSDDFACLSGAASSTGPTQRSARLTVNAEDSCNNKASRSVEILVQIDNGTEPSGKPFLRGDANLDGKLQLDDAVQIVKIATGKVKDSPCLDAADANDDGKVRVNDAIAVILVIHKGGRLPAPYPAVGLDPTPDRLTCTQYPAPLGSKKNSEKEKDKNKGRDKGKEKPGKGNSKKK